MSYGGGNALVLQHPNGTGMAQPEMGAVPVNDVGPAKQYIQGKFFDQRLVGTTVLRKLQVAFLIGFLTRNFSIYFVFFVRSLNIFFITQ